MRWQNKRQPILINCEQGSLMIANKMVDGETSLQFFRQMFAGAWITQGLAVAAELGIADLLAERPRTADELAELTGTHAGALYRVLRALASVGVFAEEARHRFALTPPANLLQTDAALSQRAYATMMGAEFQGAWGELLHTARTGEPGFEKRFGKPFFEYMTEHAGRQSVYDTAMTVIHGPETELMLDAYDFAGFRTVADIGGGEGLMLTSLLERHREAQGILFDLPAVAERARAKVSSRGLQNRCRIEAGDFFRAVPAAADAYLLRHIVHDWEDADARRILQNCREAMNEDSKVLVVEMVIPPGNAPAFVKWLDLMMLVVGGKERTQDEYSSLFAAAGLKLNRIISTVSEICILEGIRA